MKKSLGSGSELVASGGGVFEVSVDGGDWVEILHHAQDRGLVWRTVRIDHPMLIAAGILPGVSSRVRFTANDAPDSSIVEAGIDRFRVRRLVCDSTSGSKSGSSSGVPRQDRTEARR